MKSSYSVNLALLIVIIALFWLNKEDTAQPAVEAISALNIEDIRTISIYRDGQLSSEFSKEDETWLMTSPILTRANKTRIELLLSVLGLPVSSTLAITEQTDLSQFGLNESSPMLSLDNLQFQFGSVDMISKRRYVRHHNTLYLFEDRIAPLLNLNSHSFIDNQLLTSDQKLSYLRLPLLDNNGLVTANYIELTKQDGHWQSKPNYAIEPVQELVDHWQYAQALQVIPAAKLGFKEEKNFAINLSINNDPIGKGYLLYTVDKAVFIVDKEQQLAYQFVTDIQQQLFLKAP